MSDDKIISLNKERMERSDDCRDWTVLDALEKARKYCEDNKVDRIHIVMGSDTGNEIRSYYITAGVTFHELIGWIEINKHRLIESGSIY